MKKNIVVILPVWGNYLDFFFNYTFKSLFFKGNVSYVNERSNLKIIVCTKKKDKLKIFDNFKKKNIFVQFCLIDEIINKNPINKILHKAYLKAFKFEKRNHKNINFILLTADDFFASNNLKYIFEFIKKNEKIRFILENKLLVNKKNFQNEIDQIFKKKKYVSKKNLVKIGFKTIDDFTKYSNTKLTKFNYSTYQLIFNINKYNMLMRGYLLHPILIRPSKQIKKMDGFFDYYLGPEYVPSLKELYVIDNSNNFFRVGIANKNSFVNIVYRFNEFKFYKSLSRWVTFYHAHYSKFSTLFSYNKVSKKKLEYVEKESSKLIEKINSNFNNKYKNYHNHPYWKKSKISKFQFIINKIKIYTIYPLLRSLKK